MLPGLVAHRQAVCRRPGLPDPSACPPPPRYNSPILAAPPLCYPRFFSLPLIIILSLTWVAWVASFLADFGVVSGRKRQIMLPTALFWTVGSAPLQVWTPPFCRKTRHLCSTRRFLQKNMQVGSFFAFCMLFKVPPRAHLAGPGTYKQGCGLIASHHFRILAMKKSASSK